MKRKLAAMVVAVIAMAAVAGPATADDFDGEELLFFGYPAYSVVDDVDFENVRERSPRDGECFVEDLDLDGFVAEYELMCYR